MLVVLFSLCLISGIAIAKPDLEKPVIQFTKDINAVEAEPNDDYTTANPLVAGDAMDAAIDPAGDVDFFAITVDAGATFAFETHAGDVGDTKLYLFDVDGTTQLDYDDDDGEGFYSLINFTFGDAGTYFVEVTGYSSSTQGTYILTATEEDPPPPPPANDVCEGAIDMQEQGLPIFTVDLSDGYTNVSNMGSDGCTGFSAPGPDAFYKIYLTQGEIFTAMEDGECDMVLYLFTDCADPMTSCVVGSDNCCSGAQELVTYVAEADGWYYLGVDAYTGAGCLVTVTLEEPIKTDDMSWGSMKSLFR